MTKAQREDRQFKKDHRQHVVVLNQMPRELAIEAPTEGDMKQMLTTGKVALADLMGDLAILKAMKTNEDDMVTAYERAPSTRMQSRSPRPSS
ncbi:hypothetical protein F4695_003898 [Rhizobium soli]|uniref:Uncharacterized protein n=1 Tax=Rhizobium soli TaxID=424798 RepID=A0A7X0JPH1_9HYPH|nr:hypothetical protein [Rhizobium soli]MBB6510507.1 hypothetical protein [Rhizobium soli]